MGRIRLHCHELAIIGTRPQYIKLKPYYDLYKPTVLDTLQHYDYYVSKQLIKELKLKIDHSLTTTNTSDLGFINNAIDQLSVKVKVINPDNIIMFGDTNTALCAALVANKLGIRCGHIEAGIRTNDRSLPEEVNRILIDELCDIHFTSRKQDNNRVRNPYFVGDLDYYYLNKYITDNPTMGNFIFLTIHHPEGLIHLEEIFAKCKDTIIFPIHHRALKYLKDNHINPPKNVRVINPLTYLNTINALLNCKGIITDSGGIQKIAPFFGKRALIPTKVLSWDDAPTIKLGLDLDWLEYSSIDRYKDFYYNPKGCKIIHEVLESR